MILPHRVYALCNRCRAEFTPFQAVIHEALMLLQETRRPAAETDGAHVENYVVADSGDSDTVQTFISAVRNTKTLAKPSYILMSGVVQHGET